MTDKSKPKTGWDKIDPSLIEFARANADDPSSPTELPVSEELQRDHHEWAKIVAENQSTKATLENTATDPTLPRKPGRRL